MDKRKKDQPNKTEQKNQLRNIARLVDEKKELENKYVLLSSKLDHLKKRMHNLNHDLRSPLGGITGMIDLMIIEGKDQIEVQTSDLIMIKESVQSLMNLINDTLQTGDTQKNLNGSKSTDKTLSSVLMEINRIYHPMAQNKGLSLSLRTYIDEEIQLSPDFFINLIQVTGNLVSNAVKFTPSNGSVEVVFTLDTDEDHNKLNMTVSDTGKSMSSDQVSAFNQGKPVARSMGTNGEQGFGIGLQHVKKLVSEEGGHISVKSEKGSGTTFSLSCPLPDKNLTQINATHFTVKNGAVLLNGSQS